jgi:serine/threonine protein kinase
MGNTASGAGAYKIKLTSDNRLGGGQYADVYKIQKKDTKEFYAAKLLKVPIQYINSLEKLGYDRELQILKETDHPFVIKYQDEFMYEGAELK